MITTKLTDWGYECDLDNTWVGYRIEDRGYTALTAVNKCEEDGINEIREEFNSKRGLRKNIKTGKWVEFDETAAHILKISAEIDQELTAREIKEGKKEGYYERFI